MNNRILGPILLLVLLASLSLSGTPSAAAPADFAIPRGHFYTQAAGTDAPAGTGYAIADEGTDERGQSIAFWTAFQRLGGVNALGYPASRRFLWNGFVSQATQRVVLQWRPEANTVYFVNVMDLLTEAGKDDYLQTVRQTPKPFDFKPEEQSLSFQQIVAKRYALLDSNAAIKAKYFSFPDPLNMNGLPTAPITDMGDAYVLRAQRIIIQQWKKDMPWAKAGTVTVALGGDIAKETDLLEAQDPLAIVPQTADEVGGTAPTAPPAASTISKTALPLAETILSSHGWTPAQLQRMGVTRKIEAVVLHYTADSPGWQHGADGNPTLHGLLYAFALPGVRVSTHYVVDRQGRIGLVQPEQNAAWHAGPVDRQPGLSWSWTKGQNGKYNGNYNSIGIEIINRDGNKEDYTDEQYTSVARLVKDIVTRYGIPIDRSHIVGHQELSKAKADPGSHWNWDRFMRLVKSAP